MAYTTIDDPGQYFNTVTYTGDGSSSNAITGVGFQSNLIWIKNRDTAEDHALFDSVRGQSGGVYYKIRSNATNAQDADSQGLSTIGSDGFTVKDNDQVNKNSDKLVAWCWKEDTTAGFDIITYSGSSSSQDISHGLGVKPDWILNKIISTTGEWNVYHDSFAQGERIKLNSTGAKNTNNSIYDALPDSSVIHIGTSGDINTDGATHVFYAWRAVKGFSAFGSYIGNGSSDGTYVHLGFRPAFVIRRRTDSGNSWGMNDNKRNTFNITENLLLADSASAAGDGTGIDLLSNGFKMRTNSSLHNASGGTYIYMAFAESPFVNSNGVPTNAR